MLPEWHGVTEDDLRQLPATLIRSPLRDGAAHMADVVDAVNFGPGHTAYAHHPAERVAVSSLVTAYEVLHRFLTSPIGEDGG